MLSKLLTISKIAACGAIGFALVCVGVLALQVRQDTNNLAISLTEAIGHETDQADLLIAGAATTLDRINAPCQGPDKGRCGTLTDLNQTLLAVRMAAGQITAVSNAEKQQLEAVNRQETQLYKDSHQTMLTLNKGLAQADSAIAGMIPLEQQLTLEIEQMRAATVGVTTLVNDPNIKGSAANVNRATGNVADTTADVQQAVHKYLHPTWAKRISDFMLSASEHAAKFIF